MQPGFHHLLNQYSQSLKDCRNIYLRSAQLILDNHADLVDQPRDQFIGMMDDLHGGLVVKLFISIAGIDHVWTSSEEQMASVLVFHLWQQQLTKTNLRAAIAQFSQQASRLNWESLIRPYKTIGPLQEFIPQLETSIMRMGNIIAKADGHPTSIELDELKRIQRELLAYLYTSNKSRTATEQSKAQSRQAIETMKNESRDSWDSAKDDVDVADSKEQAQPPISLEESLAQLQDLVGMDSVKEEVRTLTNFLTVQKRRVEAGLPETHVSLHMVFRGNPGTGKTTVARILGRIYGAMGVLKKGHMIETDRSGLVAEFAGQTAPKTNKIIDQALDGILFIDEAYSLIAESGDDPFGQEAIQTLLKRMEDDRDRLVIVIAGYPAEMDRLLKSNPGLSSRFGRSITFEDYRPRELGQILGRMCELNQYKIKGLTQAKTLVGLNWLYHNRDKHFGNGRLVRNIFEKAIRNLANRIVEISEIDEDLLTKFEITDIEIEGAPCELLEIELLERSKYRVVCPDCLTKSKASADLLGRRVRCKKCDAVFVASWGQPVVEVVEEKTTGLEQ